MKIIFQSIIILFLCCGTAFSRYGSPDIVSHEDFENSLGMINSMFTQRATQTGANGMKVTCIMTPAESVIAVGFEIENSNYDIIDIKKKDIRFYDTNEEFYKISPREAIDGIYKWNFGETTTSTHYYLDKMAITSPPGESDKEEMIYKTAFKYGETTDPAIKGVVYFNCRLKDIKDVNGVTVEITINGELFKFNFEGGAGW